MIYLLNRMAKTISAVTISASAIVPVSFAGTAEFSTLIDGNILDQDGDTTFDTVTLSPGSISIRHFDGVLSEKGVMIFDLSSLQGRELNSVFLDARVVGYTSSTGDVSVVAYSDDEFVDLSDAIKPAVEVGQYNPVDNGLNPVQIALDTSTIQSLIGTGNPVTIRIESPVHVANTQLASSSSSWPPSLIIDYDDYTNLSSLKDGRILDSEGDGIFDTVTTSPTSLSVRNFSVLKEISISNFNVDAATGMAAQSAQLGINIRGIANNTSQVDIYGFNDDLAVDLNDASLPAVLLASYNPTALGLGDHLISLDASSLNPLIKDGGPLSLRFSSGEYAANTQLDSLYFGGPTLELDLVVAEVEPEPPVADAGADQQVKKRSIVTLNGAGSFSVDEPIVEYNWTQVSGESVSLSSSGGSEVTFQAPRIRGNQVKVLTFELTVTDALGMIATDQVSVTVTKN